MPHPSLHREPPCAKCRGTGRMRITPPEGATEAFAGCEDCGGTGTMFTSLLGVPPLTPDPDSDDPLMFAMPAPPEAPR